MIRAALAATFALALVGTAQAAPALQPVDSDYTAVVETPDASVEPPYHPCHGRTSGTASHACGTATGGPSGGLF